MKKIKLLLFALLLGEALLAQSSKVLSNNQDWVTQGSSGQGEPARIFFRGVNPLGAKLSLYSGYNYSTGNAGDIELQSLAGVKSVILDVLGTATHFSFVEKDYMGPQALLMPVSTKFGIGTENPTMTLDLGNLAPNDGIKFGDKFKIRQFTPTDNNFVMENIAPSGNLYLRSRTGSNTSGNLILNDAGGNVGIGTVDPKNRLSVNGTIWAKEVKVSLVDAADWVFVDGYELPTLFELERYINKNHHLPEIPSAEEFRKEGLQVSEITNKLLQKIEELTLYTIQQEKKIKHLEDKIISFEKLEKDLQLIKEKFKNLKED